jgi:hypothetical protein
MRAFDMDGRAVSDINFCVPGNLQGAKQLLLHTMNWRNPFREPATLDLTKQPHFVSL